MSSDESSLSSMEEPRIIRRPRRRPLIGSRSDFFVTLSEEQFKDRFRFTKETVRVIFHQIKRFILSRNQRQSSVSPMLQLLLTLRFYATGSFQAVIGDTAGVSKATVCRAVERVSSALACLRAQYVQMPTSVERPSVAARFYDLAGFPRVIGAVDCTHVKIISPGGNRAELFRNRKGYFSVNVQAICDANLKIRSVIARWPGSVHDTTIWNDSPLAAHFESGRFGSYLVLGDSGYPCLRYLLTPFLNPATASQEAYNKAQITTRNTIERCFGVLKRRFPCLHSGMQLKLQKVLKVIVACVVLHNMTLDLENYMVEDELIEDNQVEITPPSQHAQNFAVRASLVQNYFSN